MLDMINTNKAIYEKSNMSITGATPLSVWEAEKLPRYLCKYDRWYWLLRPGLCLSSAAVINWNGSVNWVGSYVDEEFCYVRPAQRLTNTDASNIQIGDRFEFGNAEFEVIAKNLAFCTSDIGYCAFRKDCEANNANDY